MLESEAKTKWCPFSRVLIETELEDDNHEFMTKKVTSSNRVYADDEKKPEDFLVDHRMRCIGSKCMAWRWSCVTVEEKDGEYPKFEMSKTEGFCGLAGRP